LLLIGCAYLFFTGIFELLLGRMLWQLGFAASMLFAVGGLLFPLLSMIGILAAKNGKTIRFSLFNGARGIQHRWMEDADLSA
ncbi:MAG: hypothetical protein IJF15_00135, partial [Oscillospiraceae bacterium]|nr:hypothetical protein [Oscillospiraceae bacterium]